MNSLKIYIGDYTYYPEYRSFLVDLLKPIIPVEKLEKYNMSQIPLVIIHNRNDSDCFVLPYSWNYYVITDTISVANQLIRDAQKINKKILIWVTGDYYYSIPQYDNIIGLYTSPYKSKQNVITIPLPIIIQDPLLIEKKKKISLSIYNSVPQIGFCGQVDSNLVISIIKTVKLLLQNIKYYLHLSKFYPGPITPPTYLRKKILNILDKMDNVQTKFIRRNRYQGGEPKERDSYEQLRKEFYQNIENTNYTLCIRGAGNFSARFYETLALGRIPIFINTDCILPFDDIIEWKKHIIWIEQNEISDINSKILEYHNGLTQDSFTNIQDEDRQIWEQYFSFPGFIQQLISYFKKEFK